MSNYHSYTPSDGHGLKHSPLKALIAPRPIGWISSVSADGVANLAPYSFFNAFCESPPILGFVSAGRKDSLKNIEATGEFVHNVCPTSLSAEMVESARAYSSEINEIDKANLTVLQSDLVKPPRIAEAPASMECKLIEIKEMAGLDGVGTNCWLITGEVVRIHINEDLIVDGIVDEERMSNLGRLGYFNYTSVKDVFPMRIPKVEA